MTDYKKELLWTHLNFYLGPVHWLSLDIHDEPSGGTPKLPLMPRLKNARMVLEHHIAELPKEHLEFLYRKGKEKCLCIKLGHLRPMAHSPERFICLLCGIEKNVNPGYDGAFTEKV